MIEPVLIGCFLLAILWVNTGLILATMWGAYRTARRRWRAAREAEAAGATSVTRLRAVEAPGDGERAVEGGAVGSGAVEGGAAAGIVEGVRLPRRAEALSVEASSRQVEESRQAEESCQAEESRQVEQSLRVQAWSLQVEQLGRAVTTPGPRRILFTDVQRRVEVQGRAYGADETTQTPRVELWFSPAHTSRVASAPTDFESAYAEASRFAGFSRVLEVRPPANATLWVTRYPREAPARPDRLVISDMEPVQLAARQCWRGVGAMTATLAAGLVCTGLVLWPPAFGAVSTLGGVACLVFFLLVQPAGVAAEAALQAPSAWLVGGLWRDPSPAPRQPSSAKGDASAPAPSTG